MPRCEECTWQMCNFPVLFSKVMICLILVAVVANMLVRIMKEGEHPFVVFQIIFMLNVEVLKNILV
jgi:hypothetical protein